MNAFALLGPQRLAPFIAQELDALSVGGPVAAVTAGWQEREAEDDELRALQRLYRFRLDYVLEPARQLLARTRAGKHMAHWLDAERQASIEAARVLDATHLERVATVNANFEARWQPNTRPSVVRQRDEIAAVLDGCEALLIAGGHIAVLLNRMRLLDLPSLLGDHPIVAWSAGAMVLTERIVLFHDSPPQGFGNAEVLENGLGLAHGIVALPHARHRLRLDDPIRAKLLARRFAPATCVPLDESSRLRGDGRQWTAGRTTTHIDTSGAAVPFKQLERST